MRQRVAPGRLSWDPSPLVLAGAHALTLQLATTQPAGEKVRTVDGTSDVVWRPATVAVQPRVLCAMVRPAVLCAFTVDNHPFEQHIGTSLDAIVPALWRQMLMVAWHILCSRSAGDAAKMRAHVAGIASCLTPFQRSACATENTLAELHRHLSVHGPGGLPSSTDPEAEEAQITAALFAPAATARLHAEFNPGCRSTIMVDRAVLQDMVRLVAAVAPGGLPVPTGPPPPVVAALLPRLRWLNVPRRRAFAADKIDFGARRLLRHSSAFLVAVQTATDVLVASMSAAFNTLGAGAHVHRAGMRRAAKRRERTESVRHLPQQPDASLVMATAEISHHLAHAAETLVTTCTPMLLYETLCAVVSCPGNHSVPVLTGVRTTLNALMTSVVGAPLENTVVPAVATATPALSVAHTARKQVAAAPAAAAAVAALSAVLFRGVLSGLHGILFPGAAGFAFDVASAILVRGHVDADAPWPAPKVPTLPPAGRMTRLSRKCLLFVPVAAGLHAASRTRFLLGLGVHNVPQNTLTVTTAGDTREVSDWAQLVVDQDDGALEGGQKKACPPQPRVRRTVPLRCGDMMLFNGNLGHFFSVGSVASNDLDVPASADGAAWGLIVPLRSSYLTR
jgi:hypothetical protein